MLSIGDQLIIKRVNNWGEKTTTTKTYTTATTTTDGELEGNDNVENASS